MPDSQFYPSNQSLFSVLRNKNSVLSTQFRCILLSATKEKNGIHDEYYAKINCQQRNTTPPSKQTEPYYYLRLQTHYY